MLKDMLLNVRKKAPLIHSITNNVTANDCANILLACGASAIMAEAPEEVEEITAICAGSNLNMGTLNQQKKEALLKAGKKANELGHPVVLDPVGVGASAFRNETAKELLEQVKFAIIRGNISEMKTILTLVGGDGGEGADSQTSRGVDAVIGESVTRENLPEVVAFAKDLAKKTGAIIAITGTIDVVADDKQAYCIFNGHEMMRSVTGSGCQLSALIAAYVTANQDKTLEATAAAVCAMGICGEKAFARLGAEDGNATYRNYIIDAVYRLDGVELERNAKFEIY